MRVEIVNDHLEVTSTETGTHRQKAERFSRDYAVMRSGLSGGHGTRLTLMGRDRTRIDPTNGKLEAVRAAMEADYARAMKVNVEYLRETDLEEDLP